MNRVHVIGGSGSGKSTFSRAYSNRYELPHYQLDDIYWLNAPARISRDEEDRDNMLLEVLDRPRWILEGIFWQDWVEPAFERAELIVVLNIPEWLRHYRVVTRHLKLLANAEPNEYRYFFPTIFELIKLNRKYDAGPYQQTLRALQQFDEKLVMCSTSEELRSLMSRDTRRNITHS